MSKQISLNPSTMVYRFLVRSSLQNRSHSILDQLPSIGIPQKHELQVQDLYFFEGNLTGPDLQGLAGLISDPVTERCTWRLLDDRVASINYKSVIEVALRPGVTDNTAVQLERAAREIGVYGITAVATGQHYEFGAGLAESELHRIARALLVNDTIQHYTLGEILPEFVHKGQADDSSEKSHLEKTPITIPITELDPEGLLELSRQRRLALNLDEMSAIQAYFKRQQRQPTDAELETLAQTWSEHCVHKTFKADIRFDTGEEIHGLLRSTIMAATNQINAPWVRSAFVDNAGIIAFDDEYDLSFKVETHNHPSAIEPFGGANTGVGGVVRDNLGVSHRPIAVTDVLCFGPEEQAHALLPEGVLHPRRVRDGVVAGVGDYGNKLGLATVNGAVLYHPGYTANPLVYCGCIGMGPRDRYPRQPLPGDRVIVIGGRTGRDGLRGATFSSLTMDAQTGQVAGASVQIGDPITEKGVIEVVEQARDAGLYHAITDCGAGGLSSAVGEMSQTLGARVHLEKVSLKYAGLAPWEIWLSEAQERMVLAVPQEKLPDLAALCKVYEVEWSDLGEFTSNGRLEVLYEGCPVVNLDNEFLHHGIPPLKLEARRPPAYTPPANLERPLKAILSNEDLALRLLSHPNIASKEDIIRRYDHEVRGATLVRPFAGPYQEGPSDAALLKPQETKGWQGFTLSNGINPYIGEVDAYAMAFSAVDEAIRNAVAVGADPRHMALLDNFCWGDPRRPEILGSLVQAAQGCHDAAIFYNTPFISGKDSLNNEYLGNDGRRHAIPGTLLISAIAIHPDVRRTITMDLTRPGNLVYLVGDFRPALAGSYAAAIAGAPFFQGTQALLQTLVKPERAPQIYRTLHTAIMDGRVRAVHDLSEGGLVVSACEMALGGRLGLRLDITDLDAEARLALFAETNGCFLVEVAPEEAEDFEELFDVQVGRQRSAESQPSFLKHYPYSYLGKVTETPLVEIIHSGLSILQLAVPDLIQSFSGK